MHPIGRPKVGMESYPGSYVERLPSYGPRCLRSK